MVALQTLTATVGPCLWNLTVNVPAAAARLPQISFHSATARPPIPSLLPLPALSAGLSSAPPKGAVGEVPSPQCRAQTAEVQRR